MVKIRIGWTFEIEGYRRLSRSKSFLSIIPHIWFCFFFQTIAAIKKSQEILEKKKLLRKKTEEKRKEAIKLTSDLKKRSQSLLEKQLEEQKALIKKIELGGIDEKQKKSIMEAIKLLQDSIEKIKKDLLTIAKPVKKTTPVKKTKEEVSK